MVVIWARATIVCVCVLFESGIVPAKLSFGSFCFHKVGFIYTVVFVAWAQVWWRADMTCLRLTVFALSLFSIEALRKPQGIAGDPVPPPYPVVNVHVPEPLMGTDDFKSESNMRQSQQDTLLGLEERILSTEKQALSTMESLALQVENVADMIQAQMSA